MSILEIKTAIRASLALLAEAAMSGDNETAGKHFDDIMMLTGKLGDYC
jgi:hypothetical protein|tara:strand:+ start:751 stop:894 length:144 start_codon:yes stop_codon:yes gene_type:complete